MLAFLAAALAVAPAAPAAPETPAPTTAAPAAPSAPSSPALENSVPWWEKITVTVDDKGKQQSCRYEASHSGEGAKDCDEKMAASITAGGKGPNGQFTKMTFERRFSPGGRLDSGRLQPGDTLLGRQVMFLTFDPGGAIQSCEVVAASGEHRPAYDCDEAKKEQFRPQASAGPAPRQAFMTILAYGHTEHIA